MASQIHLLIAALLVPGIGCASAVLEGSASGPKHRGDKAGAAPTALDRPEHLPGAIPFDLLDGRPYVSVRVNGKGPFRFIFDTGGVNLLTSHLAAELALDRSAHESLVGAGEKSEPAAEARVDRVDFGALSFDHQRFFVIAAEALQTATGVRDLRGMIGHSIFEKKALTIDYDLREIVLSDTSPPASPGRITVPFSLDDGHIPTVEGEIGGFAGTFQVDTGDRSTITLFTPFVQQSSLRSRYSRVEGVTGWGVGGPIRADVGRTDRLVLGALTVQAPVVRLSQQTKGAFASAKYAGSIGYGILCGYRVTFDYPRLQISFDRPRLGGCREAVDRGGVWLNPDGDRLRVVDVWRGGPAEAAGLHEGDIVSAVDGRPTASLQPATVRQWLRRPAGTRVRFSIASPAAREVELVLRDLY
jgi:hypothetical protein